MERKGAALSPAVSLVLAVVVELHLRLVLHHPRHIHLRRRTQSFWQWCRDVEGAAQLQQALRAGFTNEAQHLHTHKLSGYTGSGNVTFFGYTTSKHGTFLVRYNLETWDLSG